MRDLVPLRRSTFELGLPRSQLSGQQAYTNAENAHQAPSASPTEGNFFSYTLHPLPIYFRFIPMNDRFRTILGYFIGYYDETWKLVAQEIERDLWRNESFGVNDSWWT